MVTPPRDAAETVGFIDHYCWIYRSLFDVPNISSIVGSSSNGEGLSDRLLGALLNVNGSELT